MLATSLLHDYVSMNKLVDLTAWLPSIFDHSRWPEARIILKWGADFCDKNF